MSQLAMQGFLAFPLCLPGTAVWRGRQGRLYILSVLEHAAGLSKAAMKVRTVVCSVSQLSSPMSHVLPFQPCN
jgi:uncharacterized protein YfaA (DUF2138 family)